MRQLSVLRNRSLFSTDLILHSQTDAEDHIKERLVRAQNLSHPNEDLPKYPTTNAYLRSIVTIAITKWCQLVHNKLSPAVLRQWRDNLFCNIDSVTNIGLWRQLPCSSILESLASTQRSKWGLDLMSHPIAGPSQHCTGKFGEQDLHVPPLTGTTILPTFASVQRRSESFPSIWSPPCP